MFKLLISLSFSRITTFQVWVNFNALVQELLAINFLFDLALVKSFSVTWSRLVSDFVLCGGWWLLIILWHDTHLHQILFVIVLLTLSFTVISIRRSSSLMPLMIFKMIILLIHCCLNIWVLSRCMLHSAMWLQCAATALDLSIAWWNSLLPWVLLKLVLVVRMMLVVGSHRAVSLICLRSLIWIRVLFLDLHIYNLSITILSIILSVEIGWILQSRTIPIVIHLVVVLPSLARLITLLIGTLSPRRIVDAIFVMSISFIVGKSSFFVFAGVSNVLVLDWWLIIIYFDDTSLVTLVLDLDLAVDSAGGAALLFFIFAD